MKPYWLLSVLLTVCAAKASADRDIVYAARYYAPPGSHRTTHFHLYRINPDGTGKTQLTFGTGEEYAPRWSADGRRITFIAYRAASPAPLLCAIGADGRGQRVLRILRENESPPPPPTPGYRLENVWPEPANGTDDVRAKHFLVNTRTGRRLPLTVPEHDDDNDALFPMPGGGLVYGASQHNSTVGTAFSFYRLDAATGTLTHLAEGRFIAWSPDGTRFCVAPGRDTMPYSRRPHPLPSQPGGSAEEKLESSYRLVWAAPLSVRRAAGGPVRQLTPRLSYVTGADWRKAQ